MFFFNSCFTFSNSSLELKGGNSYLPEGPTAILHILKPLWRMCTSMSSQSYYPGTPWLRDLQWLPIALKIQHKLPTVANKALRSTILSLPLRCLSGYLTCPLSPSHRAFLLFLQHTKLMLPQDFTAAPSPRPLHRVLLQCIPVLFKIPPWVSSV